jgi:hypothetical protein
MLKKSLVFGSIVILLGMLLAFTGCKNPAGPEGPPGDQGTPGTPGTTPGGDDGNGNGNGGDNGGDNGGNNGGGETLLVPADAYPLIASVVTADDLAAAFEASTTKLVVLRPSVTTVYGEVPLGAALYVLGTPKVAPGERLTVLGKLAVWNGAALRATGESGANAAGYLIGGEKTEINSEDGATGTVLLPHDPTGILKADFIIYTDLAEDLKGKAIGSVVIAGTNGDITPVTTGDQIKALFDDFPAFTAYNITDLKVDSIPAGKTLTLAGPDNALDTAAGVTNFPPTGTTLILEGTLSTDATTGADVIWPSNIQISAGGVLELASDDDTFSGLLMPAGANKGKITTVEDNDGELQALLDQINGEIEAPALTTFATAFTVPAGVSLSLGPDPTTSALASLTTTDTLTVKGKLTLGNITAFDPGAAVTIVKPTGTAADEDKNNGVLVLAGNQKITMTGTLWIQDLDKIIGDGTIIAEDTIGTIDIGVLEGGAVAVAGYTTPDTGVQISKITGEKGAIAVFNDFYKNVLKIGDNTGAINLEPTYGDDGAATSIVGIGTVAIADRSQTAVMNGTNVVALPTGISIATAKPYTVAFGTHKANDNTITNYSLDLLPFSRTLAVVDGGYTGSTSKPTYLTSALKFLHNNSGLVSPAMSFNIGVDTNR